MSKEEIYRRYSRYLIRITLFIFILMLGLLFAFLAKRAKEPHLATMLFDNLNDTSVESILYQTLEESFVTQEELIDLGEGGFIGLKDADFLYRDVSLKYQPLIDANEPSPLEIWVYQRKKLIPFIERGRMTQEPVSWFFTLTNKERLSYIDARDMYLSPNEPRLFQASDDGMMMFGNSSIYIVKEWSSGFKEFRIVAAGKCVISEEQKTSGFDYSAAMKVSIDGEVLGKASAREGKFIAFAFRRYLPSGWHKLEIAFTNDIWEPEKGLDRNLLVKDVEVFNLLGKVTLRAKRGLEAKFFSGLYKLFYFRVLNDENKNELLRFFKKRFKIESMKDIIIAKGSDTQPLMREVEIGNLTKQAIFAPPPTKIKTKIKVPIDGIKLVFGFGVMQEAWDKAGDGVEFTVKLDTPQSEAEEVLFSKYINPKANESDRKWFQAEVDLRRFKGKEINLIFETKGSPVSPITPTVDNSYDWAVWSN